MSGDSSILGRCCLCKIVTNRCRHSVLCSYTEILYGTIPSSEDPGLSSSFCWSASVLVVLWPKLQIGTYRYVYVSLHLPSVTGWLGMLTIWYTRTMRRFLGNYCDVSTLHQYRMFCSAVINLLLSSQVFPSFSSLSVYMFRSDSMPTLL